MVKNFNIKKIFSGRLNRKAFAIKFIPSIIIYEIIKTVLKEMFFATIGNKIILYIIYVFAFTTNLLFSLIFLSLTIRRLHDLNLSAWYVLIFYILGCIGSFIFIKLYWERTTLPLLYYLLQILEYLAIIFLLIKKGTKGKNTYGEDSLDNNKDII